MYLKYKSISVVCVRMLFYWMFSTDAFTCNQNYLTEVIRLLSDCLIYRTAIFLDIIVSCFKSLNML